MKLERAVTITLTISGRCDGGVLERKTCKEPLEIGASCSEDSNCLSGRCDGTCKVRVVSNEPCTEDADCISAKCCTRNEMTSCSRWNPTCKRRCAWGVDEMGGKRHACDL